MKRVLLIAILLVLASVYLGVLNPQAVRAAGVIWGEVTYQIPYHFTKYDYAEILNEDYSSTGYTDTICESLPHEYWIVNGLDDGSYRLKIYGDDCGKSAVGAAFEYAKDSQVRVDGIGCADGTPEK